MATRTNLTEEQYVQFTLLSEGQKRLIYSELLEVLQYTGANIHHEGARQVFAENGCTVKDQRVFFPSQLVRWCINNIPPVTTIHHWDYRSTDILRIEQDRTYFGPGPTCPWFIDPETGERRRYLRKDAATVARLCDALPEIGFVMSLGTISDVPKGLSDVYEFAEMIQNSTKPVIAWSYSKEHCRDIHNIASIIAGGEEELRHRPIYILYNEPISPLSLDQHAIDKLMCSAKRGVPQIFAPANSAGATVPATHAAHIVVSLAESLIGVVLAQLTNPGCCIIIGGTQSIMDMRATTFSYGAPELSVLSAGISEMAEYIGLPSFIAGGCSDSKTTDLQSAIEANISLQSSLLTPGNLVHDIGFLASGMTGSLTQLVMADEILSMSRRIVQGIEVTEETMAADEIKRVGPGGSYKGTAHTKNRSQDHFRPRFLDRNTYEGWEESGRTTMKERIEEYTRSLLKEHKGPINKLSDQKKMEINLILDAAKEYGRSSESLEKKRS
ncbi:MAG: trimethylamine methyltransferase family protein [Desulfurivibrionaceae bacterium]